MRSFCALWVYAASWAVMIPPPHRCHLLSLLCGVWNAGQHIPSVSHVPCSAVVMNNLTAHSPLLLAWLLLSILTLLRLAATATLPPLLLLHWQVLIRVVVDKLIHISSFLTLHTEMSNKKIIHAALNPGQSLPIFQLPVLSLTRPPLLLFFFSLGISFGPSAKVSRFLVFSTYNARCSRSFFCSSSSLFRFSS